MNIKKIFPEIPKYVVLIGMLLVTILPFLIIIAVSFSDQEMINAYGYKLIPMKISLEGYKYIFKSSEQIIKSYMVTIFITVVGTLLSVLIDSAIAYPLSRKDFIYKKFVSTFIFIPMLFGGGIVPTYILISKYLHMVDTIWVLIIPSLVGVWYIFLMRTFFSSIPFSLIECAKIEGANEAQVFLKIILPLSKTALATVALFSSLGYWNEWFASLLYINNNNYVTLQLLLNRIMENMQFLKINKEAVGMMRDAVEMPAEPVRNAMVVIAAGPMLVIFPFFQKYFVKGITSGAVKE